VKLRTIRRCVRRAPSGIHNRPLLCTVTDIETTGVFTSPVIGSRESRTGQRNHQRPLGCTNALRRCDCRCVVPQSIQDAHEAEIVFLAVPFPAHKDVAQHFKQWNGKIVVDVTNTLDLTPKQREELLGGQLSSEVVSKAFVGARLVKAFNHLPANQLGTNPTVKGQRQAVFVSSNDADASSTVAAAATQIGFAPIELGRLDQGGVPLHVVDGRPGALLSQNLVKLG
jgi:predicted dinucleotide-binding enzyme